MKPNSNPNFCTQLNPRTLLPDPIQPTVETQQLKYYLLIVERKQDIYFTLSGFAIQC